MYFKKKKDGLHLRCTAKGLHSVYAFGILILLNKSGLPDVIALKDCVYKPLSDSSIKFLKLKKVYRWKLKKVSEMSDREIISACHAYVEDNRLNDEWNLFREENEAYDDDNIFGIMK